MLLLFAVILWLSACAKWSRTCHQAADCQSCQTCQNGRCVVDPAQLNPCGDCAPVPDEICYDEQDNDCDDLTDEDCDPCGNGRIDPGETCDGDCPTECPDDGDPCTTHVISGLPRDCDVSCTDLLITSCLDDDGCCPESCDRHTDQDCNLCGNGQIDGDETCDGDCPTDCDDGNSCTQDIMSGRPQDCDVACGSEPILTCTNDDGCCLSQCTSQNDNDCIRNTWFKTYGGSDDDEFTAVLEDASGGYLVAGQSESYGQDQLFDAWLARLDGSGYLVHQHTYGGEGKDYASAMVETADGVVLVGHRGTHTTNWDDWLLVKTDSSGEYNWQRTYGSEDEEYAYCVLQTGDQGFIVAGYTFFNWGNTKGLVMHLDSNGNLEWKKTFGESGDIYVKIVSLQDTADGGYLAAGNNYEQNWDALVLKLDTLGNLEWKQAYGGDGEDKVVSILTLPEGYLLAGKTQSFGARGSDVWILKLDLAGNIIWQKAYGENGTDLTAAVKIDPAGGFILAGEITKVNGFTEFQHVWLLKLDPQGEVVWEKAYGGPGDSHAGSVQPVADGGYVVVGKTKAFGEGSFDGLVMKVDQNGNIDGTCPEEFISISGAAVYSTDAVARNPTLTTLVTNITVDNDPLFTAASDANPRDHCQD